MANWGDRGRSDLEREPSYGSDEYPEGLPGTTPPDSNRFLKTLKLKDKKVPHGRKTSPNEAKRISRELKQDRSLYSPTREDTELGKHADVLLMSSVSEPGDGTERKRESRIEDVPPESPRDRSGSKEKILKKHSSVPFVPEHLPDDASSPPSLQRRCTYTGSSSSSPAHAGSHKKSKQSKKIAKQREQSREMKRGSMDDSTCQSLANMDILDTLSPMSERKPKLERSESFDEITRKGYLADQQDSGEEDAMMLSLQPFQMNTEETKERRTLTHRATMVNFDSLPDGSQPCQSRRHKGHQRTKGGRVLPKERSDFFEGIRWAIVKYGIGMHRSAQPNPPGTGRHFSETSIPGRRMANDLWLRVLCYLQGYAGEDQRRFGEQLLLRRFEVKNTLRAITNFSLSRGGGGSFDQDAVFDMLSKEDYEVIPGEEDATPQQSLDLHSLSTLTEGEQTGERESASQTAGLVSGEEVTSRPEVGRQQRQEEPRALEGDAARPRAKTQQSSSAASSGGPPPAGEKELCSRERFLGADQVLALRKVNQLLDQLDEAEKLYPSTAKLAEDHAEYNSSNFQRRLEALLLWSKVTSGMSQRLADLSKWFGVDIIPPSSSSNHHHRLSQLPSQLDDGSFGRPRHSSPLASSASSLSLTLTPVTAESRPIAVSPVQVVRMGRYHAFVGQGLKKGIRRMMENIDRFICPILKLAMSVFQSQNVRNDPVFSLEERTPIRSSRASSADLTLEAEDNLGEEEEEGEGEVSGTVNWLAEFEDMGLPVFWEQFLLLARVPLDVMHECLRLQQYLKPPKAPSEFSISRLVSESRETIEWALKVHENFISQLHQAQGESLLLSGNLSTEVEPFERELANVFSLYLEYIQSWIKLSDPCQALTQEWPIVKGFCKKMYQHEAKAVKRICVMVSDILVRLEEELGKEVDLYHDRLLTIDLDVTRQKKHLSEATRDFKGWLTKVKEKSYKYLGVARSVLRDLEIAADLKIKSSRKELFDCLQLSDHVEISIAGKMDREKMIFAPKSLAIMAEGQGMIVDLLTLSCGRPDSPHPYFTRHKDRMYILILHVDPEDCHHEVWPGETVTIHMSFEAAITTTKLEVVDFKLVAWNSGCVERCCRTVAKDLGSAIKSGGHFHTSNHQEIAMQLEEIKDKCIKLSEGILNLYQRIKEPWVEVWESLGDTDPSDHLNYRTMVNSCFHLGFENAREVIRLLGDHLAYAKLGLQFKEYCIQWIQFITDKYRNQTPGRRYAMFGLDFLMIGCHPRILDQLSEEEYQRLKKYTDQCFNHVAGQGMAKHKKSSTRKPGKLHGEGLPTDTYPSPILPRGFPSRSRSDATKHWDASDLMDGQVVSLPQVKRQGFPPVNEDYDVMYPPLPTLSSRHDHLKPPSSTDSSTSSGIVKDDESPPLTSLYPDTSSFIMTVAHPTSIEHIFSVPTSESSSTSHQTSVTTPDELNKITEIRLAVQKCEEDRNCILLEKRIIGKERPDYQPICRNLDSLMQVGFTWIRGIMIGKGSSGKVYQCLNAKTGETMAVKQIALELNNTPKALKRLSDEIGHLQSLTHPNIIQYYGVEIHRSELFLFMEYCPEGDIWTLSKQGLDEYMIRHYTNEALQGLSYIHSRGIVHRDIKGANMFIASNGHLKLGDFGLSFQLHNISHTRRDEICENVGTVAYMAPEVIRGGKVHRIGRGSDVWSLGCTVIEMLTGKSPWTELDNEYSVMLTVGNGRCPPIPDCADAEGREFLEGCFKLNPEERWTTTKLLSHPFVKIEHSGNGELFA